jgi:hypothetical protein
MNRLNLVVFVTALNEADSEERPVGPHQPVTRTGDGTNASAGQSEANMRRLLRGCFHRVEVGREKVGVSLRLEEAITVSQRQERRFSVSETRCIFPGVWLNLRAEFREFLRLDRCGHRSRNQPRI